MGKRKIRLVIPELQVCRLRDSLHKTPGYFDTLLFAMFGWMFHRAARGSQTTTHHSTLMGMLTTCTFHWLNWPVVLSTPIVSNAY